MRDLNMHSSRVDQLPHDGDNVHVAVRCRPCGKRSRIAASVVLVDRDPEARSPGWDGVFLNRIFRCRCGAIDQYEVPAEQQVALRLRALAGRGQGDGPVQYGAAMLWDGSVCTRPSAALQRLQDAAHEYPRSGAAWRRLGNFQRRLGALKAAEQAWRQAVEVDEEELEAAVCVALRAFERGARTAVTDLNAALGRLMHGRSAPLELRHDMAEELVSILQAVVDLHPSAALSIAWGSASVGEQAIITLSSVRLAVLRRWDRLVELFEADLVICVRVESQLPVQERTELERLLNSNIPLSLWSPPILDPLEEPSGIAVHRFRPNASPPVWRSTSKKKNRRRAAAI
jgi:hypothetical protein